MIITVINRCNVITALLLHVVAINNDGAAYVRVI